MHEQIQKLEAIRHQNYTEMQPYMKKSIDKCIIKFRLRTDMLKQFKDNFRSSNRTMQRGQEEDDTGLRCQDCQDNSPPTRDSQVHSLICPAWSHLQSDLGKGAGQGLHLDDSGSSCKFLLE